MFSWLAVPFGYIMNWLYLFVDGVLHLPVPYVFALFLFLLVTKLLTFPLSINQQKSSAKMAAIQPLMQDIQKKFAKDKARQQQEMQKLQTEMGYNPLSGCLPMGVNLVLMFGFVEVIYKPLTYMIKLPADLLKGLTTIATRLTESNVVARFAETNIIEQVKTHADAFASFEGSRFAEDFARLQHFDMSISAINLWEVPSISQLSWLWIMPLFSVAMAALSAIISSRASGAAQSGAPGTGKSMILLSVAMSAVFAFMYPVGISLYWGLNSLLMLLQSLLLRKLIDPDKIKKETLDAYYAKAKAAKAVKKVKIKDGKTGQTIEKELAGDELARLRLQRARELDAERYGDEAPAALAAPEYTGKKTEAPAEKNSKQQKNTKAVKEPGEVAESKVAKPSKQAKKEKSWAETEAEAEAEKKNR